MNPDYRKEIRRMPTRQHLVCQHLENISREALSKYQYIVREYVRRRQGVYALYRRGKLYYVGLAGNLRSRLHHHLKDRHGESWDRFSVYLTIGDRHLKELESLILRVVRPPGNLQKGKFPRSEDLRRRFKRDVQGRLRLELFDILGKQPTPRRTERKRREPGPRQRGRKPVLADYITAPMNLLGRHKGRLHRARVRRDGTIRFDGTIFTSPSLARISHQLRRENSQVAQDQGLVEARRTTAYRHTSRSSSKTKASDWTTCGFAAEGW